MLQRGGVHPHAPKISLEFGSRSKMPTINGATCVLADVWQFSFWQEYDADTLKVLKRIKYQSDDGASLDEKCARLGLARV